MAIQDLMIVGEEEIHIKDLYYVMMKNQCGNAKECKTYIKHRQVFVNDQCVTQYDYQVNSNDHILVNGFPICSQPFHYYMFYKPQGYICARHDDYLPCVMDFFEEKDCFCVGRLDMDTTGLLLICNDPYLSKHLLLPQYGIKKTYFVEVDHALSIDLIEKFSLGIVIDQDRVCQSSKLEIVDDYLCFLTLSEGKYHQVKKMFLSCGYRVVRLKRVAFAGLELDSSLNEGEYRPLTSDEIKILESQIGG